VKPFIVTAVHCTNAVGVAHVRLLVESVLSRVPREDYEALVVVDDHSAFREGYYDWGAWLEKEHGVVFHSLGEPRVSGLGPKGAPDTPGPKSTGPGGALTAGAKVVAERGGRWMWTLDSDCLVLDGSCLSAAMIRTEDPRVAAVGECRSGLADGVVSFDLEGRSVLHPDGTVERLERSEMPLGRCATDAGRVVAMCGIFDVTRLKRKYTADFTPYGGPVYAGLSGTTDFDNWGQPAATYCVGAWAHGDTTVYHPFFRGESVVHFGYASVGFTREQFGKGVEYGNSVYRAAYGGKGGKDYYAGYLQLNARLSVFQPYLVKLYDGRPFDSFGVDEFDQSLLVRP